MHALSESCLAAIIAATVCLSVAHAGRVEIAVVDAAGQPLPCRIHLYDKAGKPRRAEDLPFFRDHFVCPGNVNLALEAGTYRFEIERGPEYAQHAGTFELAENDTKTISATLERIADLAPLGWYSGDLHVHRAIEEMPLLMRAEDLHVAPVITWWNNSNLWTDRDLPKDPLVRLGGDRFYHLMAGAIEIITNGAVERSVPLGGPSRTGSLGTLSFNKSGWFLVRAVTDLEHTFRFASTAPYYVEIGSAKHRVSRDSVQFFLDWADERANRVPAKLDDAEKLREVLAYHDQARRFWQEKLAGANAE